ncbi:HD domain-containing protein [Pedobacter jamesrossensis]|uniref:HD domain-containing protein n=1 Tax=Pedobacter jamesrossensis TaxID=1908238 RepID=A0ABV8NQU8_9SPHI
MNQDTTEINDILCSALIASVREFVETFLKAKLSSGLYFHSIQHTMEVVEATIEIGSQSALSREDFEVVIIAAWFHDIGYGIRYQDHENESANLAGMFLKQHLVEESKIEKIKNCILATRYPQLPSTKLEEIICDADFYHFSRSDYIAHEQALRKEWSTILDMVFSDGDWNELNYKMLKSHQYFTPYGKRVLQVNKFMNLERLEKLTQENRE